MSFRYPPFSFEFEFHPYEDPRMCFWPDDVEIERVGHARQSKGTWSKGPPMGWNAAGYWGRWQFSRNHPSGKAGKPRDVDAYYGQPPFYHPSIDSAPTAPAAATQHPVQPPPAAQMKYHNPFPSFRRAARTPPPPPGPYPPYPAYYHGERMRFRRPIVRDDDSSSGEEEATGAGNTYTYIPAGQAAHPDDPNPYYGRSTAEIELDNAIIAAQTGATAPKAIEPKDAKDTDYFLVQDKNGTVQPCSLANIKRTYKEGDWKLDGNTGQLMFVCK